MGEVVEGQDTVVVSEGQQSGFGEREGAKGSGGLTAAGRPLKNEDGVGIRGAEGGQKPGEAAAPVLGTGKIEKWEIESDGLERVAASGDPLVDWVGGSGMAVGAGFEDAEGGAQRPCLVASGAELEGGGGAGVVAGHGSLHG
jgi:hypothetical protein